MTIKDYIISALFLCQPFLSFGQLNLSGTVTDSIGNPLYGVNIILIDLNHNRISAGTITDEEGVFRFSSLEKGIYKIEFSYLGFATENREIELEGDIQLENIHLKEGENQLDEIVVRGKKPIMELKMDRTIFNVSQTDAAIGGNAIDALGVTPGIKIKDSKIELIGKGSVKLMVNGRIVRLDDQSAFQYLKSIPTENIERLEMITNPPAEYSAEGAYGIINVVLKRGVENQFFGIASLTATQSEKFSNSENISIFHRKNGLQINGGLNHYNSRTGGYFQNDIYYDDYTLKQHNEFPSKSIGRGAFVDLGYELSDYTEVGFSARYFEIPKSIANRHDSSVFIGNQQIDSTLITQSEQISHSETQNYSFYLDHKLDTLGSKLSIEASYIGKSSNQNLDFTTTNDVSNHQERVASGSDKTSKLFYAATDLNLNRDFAEYNLGFQFQGSEINSNTVYENGLIDAQNSHFKYDEQTYSAYFSASKTFKEKWSVKLGLRSEYTLTKGNSLTLQQITEQDYWELFPTAYISCRLNQGNSFVISYGRRIERPMYSYLDPFREYFSTFSYREGNPYLRPAYNNNFEVKHIFKNKLSSSLFFSYIPNGYGELNIINNDSPILAMIRDNYLKTYQYGLVESLYLKSFSWWESNNQASIYYSNSTSSNPNTRPKLKGFGAYVNTDNTFYLNQEETFRLNFSFDYYFPSTYGVDQDKSFYEFNSGITALLFSKRLTLSVQANDIFKTSIYRSTTVTNGISEYFKGYYDSRSIRFSATYQFGNKKNRKERNVEDENKSRI